MSIEIKSRLRESLLDFTYDKSYHRWQSWPKNLLKAVDMFAEHVEAMEKTNNGAVEHLGSWIEVDGVEMTDDDMSALDAVRARERQRPTNAGDWDNPAEWCKRYINDAPSSRARVAKEKAYNKGVDAWIYRKPMPKPDENGYGYEMLRGYIFHGTQAELAEARNHQADQMVVLAEELLVKHGVKVSDDDVALAGFARRASYDIKYRVNNVADIVAKAVYDAFQSREREREKAEAGVTR